MTTIDLSRLIYLAKCGCAPDLANARAAIDTGRLYDVDTQSAGGDCVIDADSASSALEEVAAHRGLSEVPARWTATRLTAFREVSA
jgi:hypothetical protein